jgi:hypothetical protein
VGFGDDVLPHSDLLSGILIATQFSYSSVSQFIFCTATIYLLKEVQDFVSYNSLLGEGIF